MILGKNHNDKPIPFALILMNSETKEDMAGLFRSFFDIMQKTPEVILTDQQASIISALKTLQDEELWSGSHCLDSFHIIKNLRKKLKQSKIID